MLSDTEMSSLLLNKKIVFCLPGKSYSGKFLVNLVNLTTSLTISECTVYMAQTESSCIHRLRNICGGGHPLNGLFQVPFSGDITDYDYILWIDSDILFSPKNFIDLLKADKDIVTGWYYDIEKNPACGFINKTYNKFKKKRSGPEINHPIYDKDNIYSFDFDEKVTEKTDPYTIDWCGMGWMLIKRGVMEKVQYPWFAPRNVRFSEDVIDCLSEDLSFQLNLKEAGFDIWLHPEVKVGHEKIGVL